MYLYYQMTNMIAGLSKWLFFMLTWAMVAVAGAQNTISEGTLQYRIQILSRDAGKAQTPIATASQVIMLKAMQSRTDMTSNLGTETTIYDQRQGKAVLLKDYSGQKLMITLSKSNWIQKNAVFHTLKFNTSNTETITIGDYQCRLATATTADGHQISVYYLPDRLFTNTTYSNAFSLLPGIPVRYEMNAGDLLFQYELTSISTDPVPATRFDFPKTGYRVMSYEESQQIKKNRK